MTTIDIALLGMPRGLRSALQQHAINDWHITCTLGDSTPEVDNWTLHVPADLEHVSRVYAGVHGMLRPRTDVRRDAHATLTRITYKRDPRCAVPECSHVVCTPICGEDVWRTPYHFRGHLRRNQPFTGDCDCIELAVAGMGGGRPVFVKPKGNDQGHVLHLNEPGGEIAYDYCIARGMPDWGGERECFYFDDSLIVSPRDRTRLVRGVIRPHPIGRKDVFLCRWNR